MTACLMACTAPAPVPDPVRMEPSWGVSSEDTRVRVIGTGFYPSLSVDAIGSAEPDVDDGFAVFLKATGDAEAEEVPLGGVTWVDLNTVQGDVRAVLAAGVYDVRVVSPAGTSGTEFAAYTVRSTRVDRISLEIDSVTHEVFEEAAVTITLLDPSGEPVTENLGVRVTVLAPDGEPDVTFRTESFVSLTNLPDGAGFEGDVGSDGTATFYPAARVPGEYTIRVEAIDEIERVREDDVVLAWSRGSNLSVLVDLPDASFRTTAGSPFTATLTLVDQFGNPAPDAVASAFVTDSCGRWFEAVVIEGSEDVTAMPTVATGTDTCAMEQLLVSGTGGSGITGASAPFQVDPGPLARFDVVAPGGTVVAGDQVATFVTARDAYGNLVPWLGTVTSITDGFGGVPTFACVPGSPTFCTATVTRAAPVVRLVVTDGAGVQGTSGPFQVAAGQPTALQLEDDGLPWVAGEPVALQLLAEDVYGNLVSTAQFGIDDVTATSSTGDVVCGEVLGVLACVLTTATPSTTVEVSMPVARQAGATPVVIAGSLVDVAVHNGALAQVVVAAQAGTVRAGEPLPLSLTGRDAYGNAYVVQTDPVVALTDVGGTVLPDSVSLDAQGLAEVDVRFTRAGTTTVRAWQQGALLGTSGSIVVTPADAASLRVDVVAPWVEVGVDVDVRLELVDAYGNRVSEDFVADVVSRQNKAPDVALPVTNGVAVGSLAWAAWDLGDVLDVFPQSRPLLVGESAPVAVFERCTVSGPTLSMLFDGALQGRVCLDDVTGQGSLEADFSGSSPSPGQSILRYGTATADDDGVAATPLRDVMVQGGGEHVVRGFVMQGNGCGTTVTRKVFAGFDDGGAVGPLTVDPVAAFLDIDGPTSTSVRVVGGTTCRGDAAAGAPVFVRSTRGVITGATSTGSGWSVSLDNAGLGVFGLDVSGSSQGGSAHLVAWSQGEEAFGSEGLPIFGDAHAPVVWSQSPEGAVAGAVSQVRVRLSEVVDAASVAAADIRVLGPSARVVTASVAPSGLEIVLDLDSPADPQPGGWSVVLPHTITDLEGNPLAGTWGAPGVTYTGFFGAAATIDPVSTCAVDTSVFRPDGDDGVGEDADEVVLSYGASSAPAWWVVDVRTAEGVTVLHTQRVPTGTSDVWAWNGRDVTGAVVPAGTYTLSVASKGSNGNLGAACVRAVEVELVEGNP